MAYFSHLQIPKIVVDDPVAFPSIGRISDDMLRLVSKSNHFLIQYKASLHLTPSIATPKKVMFKVKEGITKDHHVIKKKHIKKKESSKTKFTIDTDVSMEAVKEKKNSNSKPKGVIIKEITDEEEQWKKKRKVVGLLKRFSKLRAQTV